MFNNDYDDMMYELFAESDYKREAYGDPCPRCGTLRWQGDCFKCTQQDEQDAENQQFEDWLSTPEARERYFQEHYGEDWREAMAFADEQVAKANAAHELDAHDLNELAKRHGTPEDVDDDIPF